MKTSTPRPYNEVAKDPAASPLERETALLSEWNKTLAENARLERELAEAREELAKRQWQPIETAPKDGEKLSTGDNEGE